MTFLGGNNCKSSKSDGVSNCRNQDLVEMEKFEGKTCILTLTLTGRFGLISIFSIQRSIQHDGPTLMKNYKNVWKGTISTSATCHALKTGVFSFTL